MNWKLPQKRFLNLLYEEVQKLAKTQSSIIAEKTFQPEDYTSKSELESGLTVTHEQVSDTLTEGTIEAKIDNVNGQNIEIPRKGYEG